MERLAARERAQFFFDERHESLELGVGRGRHHAVGLTREAKLHGPPLHPATLSQVAPTTTTDRRARVSAPCAFVSRPPARSHALRRVSCAFQSRALSPPRCPSFATLPPPI